MSRERLSPVSAICLDSGWLSANAEPVADGPKLLPIGEVLTGMEIPELGAGTYALDAVVLIKAIDEDGHVGWWTRYTADITTVESIGALHSALVLEEEQLRRIYRPIGDDD